MGLIKIVTDWRTWVAAGIAGLALMLSACGSSSPSAAPASGSAGAGTSQSAPASPVQAQPAGNDACTILTRPEMSAILGGAPVQGATATIGTSGPGYICNFGSDPFPGVSASGAIQYHEFSLIQLEYQPGDEHTLWSTYVTKGSPVPGDQYGVRSLNGQGFNDAVKLRNGEVLSATAGISGITGSVISGTPAALVAALDAAAARS